MTNIYRYHYSIPIINLKSVSQIPIVDSSQDLEKIQAYRQLAGAILYFLGRAIKINTEDGKSIYVNKHHLYIIIQSSLLNKNKENQIGGKFKLPAIINQLTLSLLIYSTSQKTQQSFNQITKDNFIAEISSIHLHIESIENLKEELEKFIELLEASETPSLQNQNRRFSRLRTSMDENSEYSSPLDSEKLRQFKTALGTSPLNIQKFKEFVPLLKELMTLVEKSKIEKQKYYQDSIQHMSHCLKDLIYYPNAIESIELSSLINLIRLEERFLELSTPLLNVYKSDNFLMHFKNLKNDLFAKLQSYDQVDQILKQLTIANDLVNLSHHAIENLRNSQQAKAYRKKINCYSVLTLEIADHMKILTQRLSKSEIEQALCTNFSPEGLYKRAGHVLEQQLKDRKRTEGQALV